MRQLATCLSGDGATVISSPTELWFTVQPPGCPRRRPTSLGRRRGVRIEFLPLQRRGNASPEFWWGRALARVAAICLEVLNQGIYGRRGLPALRRSVLAGSPSQSASANTTVGFLYPPQSTRHSQHRIGPTPGTGPFQARRTRNLRAGKHPAGRTPPAAENPGAPSPEAQMALTARPTRRPAQDAGAAQLPWAAVLPTRGQSRMDILARRWPTPATPAPNPATTSSATPNGPKAPSETAPPREIRLAIQISRNLKAKMKEERLTAKELVDRTSGDPTTRMSRQTIQNILKGHTLADLPTIARIEAAIGTRIWGDAHIPKPQPERKRDH